MTTHKMTATESAVRLAKDALQCQDACNASGVIHSLSRWVTELRQHPDCTGTDWINCNPILVVVLDKLCSLANCQTFTGDTFNSFQLVEKLARQEHIEY